ncbi:unnamed protein product [Effrenium voratum]|nr:unnamed protein product [Effrenium voratum]
MYDSTVLLEYVHEVFAGPPLLPSSPYSRAKVRLWSKHVDLHIVPNFDRLLAAHDPETRAMAREDLLQALSQFEAAMAPLAKGPFFLGDDFSMADCVLAPWWQRMCTVLRAYRKFDPSTFSRLQVWFEAVEARPCFSKTAMDPEKLIEEFSYCADPDVEEGVRFSRRGLRNGRSVLALADRMAVQPRTFGGTMAAFPLGKAQTGQHRHFPIPATSSPVVATHRMRGLQRLLAEASNLRQLQALLQEFQPLHRWPAFAHATAWHRLAKLSGGKATKLEVQRLNEALVDIGVANFDARGCANVLYAWAKLRNVHGPLAALCAQTTKLISECKAQELSNVFYALGLLRHREAALLAAACKEARSRTESFSAQDAWLIVYALALLRYKDKVAGMLASATCDRLGEFTSQGVANMVYSLGLLRVRHRPFLVAASEYAGPRLAEFSEQEMANLVYGMALLKWRASPRFLEDFCHHALAHFEIFKPRGVSCVFYSLALLDFREERFFLGACDKIQGQLNHFNAQDISNIVYGLGLLELPHAGLLEALELELPGRLSEFTAQGLGNVVYGCGLLDYRCPTLLHAIVGHLPSRLELTEQNISNVVWALGRLNVVDADARRGKPGRAAAMLSPNANSAEQDKDLPSHLARAQQAFDRVSEQLSSLRASRVKASPSKASSGETEAAEGVRQFKEAKEELKQGLEALRASRSAHLALRRQVAQELQGLDLSWDRGVVSSILAASGLGPKRFDSEPQADAEAAASKLSEVPETDSPLPSPPCTPSRDATSSPSQAKATSPNRAILHTPVRRSSAAAKAVRWTRPVSPKDHIRDLPERPSPGLRRTSLDRLGYSPNASPGVSPFRESAGKNVRSQVSCSN